MPADLDTILRIEVPVIVQIASRRMPAEEIAGLSPGAILELPKEADEPLDVLVNNRPIGRGAAVKVGENFGVAINEIRDLQSRIAAMGPVGAAGGTSDDTDGLDEQALAILASL